MRRDLVIARFEENLDWLEKLPLKEFSNIYIYNKGNTPDSFKSYSSNVIRIRLKNVGHDCNTYLFHVLMNYENLADVVFFFQGDANQTFKRFLVSKIIDRVIFKNEGPSYIGVSDLYFRTLGTFEIPFYRSSNVSNCHYNPSEKLSRCAIVPYGKWFEHIFPNERMQSPSFKSHFSVSKSDILKRSFQFYLDLYKQTNVFNGEIAHFCERAWPVIFSIDRSDTFQMRSW